MAITLITTIERYQALSTDDKPTGCSPGSTLSEIDTGEKFIFDGTNWIEDVSTIYAINQAIGG